VHGIVAPPCAVSQTSGAESAAPVDLAALEKAVRAHPDDARSWYRLGWLLNRADRPVAAIGALNNALALSPDHVDVMYELGQALTAARFFPAAADIFEDILASRPLHGPALFSLAVARYRQNRWQEAAALWRRAADILPDPVEALENLAVTCQHLKLQEQERLVWRELLSRDPHNPMAAHKLAALGEMPAPERTSDACIVQLFDSFADDFDSVLATLDYRGPELAAKLLHDSLGEPAAALDILDAGCGTGLCGERIKPWARRLTGVDLSPRMLAKARTRGVFDELVEKEITACLLDLPAAFDVIVSCDVLNYFGDLSQVLDAACRALRPEGLLLFSLEAMRSSQSCADYALEPHGRYSHSWDYVCSATGQAGFGRVEIKTDTLRSESGEQVAGWIVVARRPAGRPRPALT